ncbi:MAG: calcium/sodium antiporter [Gemmatimonadota bacterium]|nr:calcium/sodium antiporter [Gemmatimonadota bacterium]
MLSVLWASVLVVVGIGVLTAGGEALVRGAVSLAKLLRVSTAVVGLTLVAMGTSMPELAVSLLAGLEGRADIAVGNVVGSNIFNIAVIVGLSALIVPLMVHMTAVRLEWPFMFVTSFLFLLLARDGVIDRLEGAFFLIGLVGFTAWMIRVARTEIQPADAAELEAAVTPLLVHPSGRRVLLDVGFVVLGLVLLVAGARVLVHGAVTLADLAGFSERSIGLTIVAAGTSMPELATSLVAARRKQPDIALANVIGSNIFNIAGILGLVSVITPQAVHPQIVASDTWWMVGAALLLWPFMRTGMRISRREGLVLLTGYAVYLWLLLR